MTNMVIENLQTRAPGLSAQHLEVLNLVVPGREIAGISGPSGSGKSLLLRAIADLDPSTGDVLLDNLNRKTMTGHEWRQRVCYLPSESAWWFEKVGEHFIKNGETFLQQLGFDDAVLGWDVTRLSSGEKQRLALARCLGRSPQVLLLDEPTSSLDEARILSFEHVVSDYADRACAPVLWVSHDQEQLARIAKHLVSIQADGTIRDEYR